MYKIPIDTEEQQLVYIGQTAGTLATRLYQHQYSLQRLDNNTALKNFLIEHKNAIPLWKQSEIISAPYNTALRLWREALEISIHKNAININAGKTIANIWQPLIEEISYKSD